MTRKWVYWTALAVFTCTTALTLTSLFTTHWVEYSIREGNTGNKFTKTVGLHRTCNPFGTPEQPLCQPFPSEDQCREFKTFCSWWRTSNFLLWFATIFELATLVTFLVVLFGGKYKRESGWKLISCFLVADAVVEFFTTGIVTHLVDNNHWFFNVPGWQLGYSYWLCTASASVSVLLAWGLVASAYTLPLEDDYEYLEDPLDG
ncbi:hypothetical protein F5Y18DRAFT_368649 [Xylariaceae sp. FL1019]|nr:hypothetical protein F5Y18DRAFT_368649 [Xylariaceae sp. FL1019]